MAGTRVVIVGGGGTGDAAAFALRKGGFDGEVTILSAEPDRPYDRPYMSKEFLRGEIEPSKVFLHDAAEYARERIELRAGVRVTDGSLSEHSLTVAGGDLVPFDILVTRRTPSCPTSGRTSTTSSRSTAVTLRARTGCRGAAIPTPVLSPSSSCATVSWRLCCR